MKLLNKSGMRPMLLGAVAVLAMPMSLNAQDFAGETIEWTVPFGVGGGTDVWARFFAPQLSQALPGKPTVVVLNVPGGGSISGANQFATRASHDGLSIWERRPRRNIRPFWAIRACAMIMQTGRRFWPRPRGGWSISTRNMA